jgi:hypothetical protein
MPPRDDDDAGYSRRRLLRTGGAALGTGLTATLAGCPSGIPPLSGSISFGRLDAPAPVDDDYAKWIPAMSQFETSDEEATLGHAWHAQPARLSASVFGPGSLPVGITTGQIDYFGVGYRNYERAIALLSQPVRVVIADFDRATVADAVDGTRYTESDPYREYTVYERSDVPRAVAVADGVLVYGQSGPDDPEVARARVETVIDAGAGRIPRQVEADSGFATLVERAGSRPANWLGSAPFGGLGQSSNAALESLVTSSISWDYDDAGVYFVYDLVFPEGEQAPAGAIKDALRGQQRAVDSALVDVETDGRFARIEMRLTRQSVRESGDGHPQITWGVEHDRAEGTVTFRHEAGEQADPATLSIDGAGDATPFRDVGMFEPGDSVTVPVVDPDERLQIVYSSPDRDGSMALFGYTIRSDDDETEGETR